MGHSEWFFKQICQLQSFLLFLPRKKVEKYAKIVNSEKYLGELWEKISKNSTV